MPTATLTPDPNQLALLADAISEVSYWTWWAQELPDVFQLEACRYAVLSRATG